MTQPGLAAEQVFSHMKRAYHVRSAIVHGGHAKPGDLCGPSGEKTDLGSFVKITEGLIRAALRKAVETGVPDRWEARILSALRPAD